ncbi:MAG: cytidine deaminase [Acidobacteria bacterium]|nr:cytidine deaminase [Acidobacteriota bacterium]
MAAPAKPYLGYYPEAELVLAIVCPLGTAYERCVETLENYLAQFGYQAHRVRLSDFFDDLLSQLGSTIRVDHSNPTQRAKSKILAGNTIREVTSCADVMALFAAGRIAGTRPKEQPLFKTCHIIATLKRPEEVDTLRRIYGPGFFLIGISSTKEDREAYLRELGMADEVIDELIETDAKEELEHGQQTREAFHLADVFVSMSEHKNQIPRFLDLLCGCPKLTPRQDEHGMFLAYAASLSSGDLSRQVGAAIVDEHGDVLAVGYNEVPKAFGGVYGSQEGCQRDLERGVDSNDLEKLAIARRIAQALGEGDEAEAMNRLRETGFFDITEFGRSVHAEMAAILACTRTSRSPRGATLYTTTFPCHNCARHIVTSGIRKVVYIEPYAKSKAPTLHDDAISIDQEEEGKIPFLPFIGVGPRRYFDLFSLKLSTGYPIERKRKEDGKLVEWERSKATLRMQLQPTSYLRREILALKALEELLSSRRASPENA